MNLDRLVVVSDWLVNYITKEPYMFAKKLSEQYLFKLILLSKNL